MKHWICFFVFSVSNILLLAAQTQAGVDFKTLSAELELFPIEKMISGSVELEFQVNKNLDSIFLDAHQLHFVKASTALPIQFRATTDKIWMMYPFVSGQTYKIKFSYTAQPQRSMYFVGWDNPGSNQVWTQGQGKKTSYWLPSIDDYTEKMLFKIKLKAPADYRVIASGELVKVDATAFNQKKEWVFEMKHPMSSYLLALVVGKYRMKSLVSESGIPIKLFYEPQDSLYVEPTYRHSKLLFDFLEKEIGIPFPWSVYKQVPVRDFLYAGMENTTLTIFSNDFVVDSTAFFDRNYVKVNAHELTHQWFGDFVTKEKAKDQWLQEGFATYYALLAERAVFGDDYYYFKLYQSFQKLHARSRENKGEVLLKADANSLTFYQKGAWALHILREKIGDKAFREAVKNYLQRNAYSTVTTSSFMDEVKKSSGLDLVVFEDKWLKQQHFPVEQAKHSLLQSDFIRAYFHLKNRKIDSLKIGGVHFKAFQKAIRDTSASYIGYLAIQKLVQTPESPAKTNLLQQAFTNGSKRTRQAIALFLTDIPKAIKANYETLLQDASYRTQESALYHLWMNFPESRKKYLNKTKGVVGFPDRNVQILWLALHIATPNFEPGRKQQIYAQLSGFTAPQYAYSIRERAFNLLVSLQLMGEDNFKDLLEACFHKVWKFRKFSRALLERLCQDPLKVQELKKVIPELPQKQQEFLTKKLK